MSVLLAEGLFAFLSGATSAGNRVYPKRLPQGVILPAITYALVSDPVEHSQSGPSSLGHPRYQLDCWDQGYLGACNLAEQVMATMDGYRGQAGGVQIDACLSEDRHDNDDPDTGRYWVSIDFVIWHQRG